MTLYYSSAPASRKSCSKLKDSELQSKNGRKQNQTFTTKQPHELIDV